jgi:hypothetical protein
MLISPAVHIDLVVPEYFLEFEPGSQFLEVYPYTMVQVESSG